MMYKQVKGFDRYYIYISGDIYDTVDDEQVKVIYRKNMSSYKNNVRIPVVRLEVNGEYVEKDLRELIIEHFTKEEINEFTNKEKEERLQEVLEEWKDIEGFEGIYKLSNKGRVFSLRRTVKNKFGKEEDVGGKIIKNQYNSYLDCYYVQLSKKGKATKKYIDVLLESHFGIKRQK